MLTPVTLTLLTFTEDEGFPIHSLHRDEDTAQAALAGMLRERWHRVAGRDLGKGVSVPASTERLTDAGIIALYNEAMEHIEFTGDPRDVWGTQPLTVEVDLVALLHDAATLVDTLRSRLDDVLTVCDRYDGGLFPLAHVRAAAQGRRPGGDPAAPDSLTSTQVDSPAGEQSRLSAGQRSHLPTGPPADHPRPAAPDWRHR
jgi:hypothetical protein